MVLKPTINYLTREELTYELSTRGGQIGIVEEMRKTLTLALHQERCNPEQGDSYPDHPYTADEDEMACTAKLDEVKALLESFSRKDVKRVETKLWHVLGRIRAMDEFSEARDALLAAGLQYHERFEKEVAKFDRPSGVEVLEASLQQICTPVGASTPTRSGATVNPPPVTTTLRRSVPVHKWGLKFTGRPGVSVNAFLERVDELSEARGVSDDELHLSALDLFDGPALAWYRAVRREVCSWPDLAQRLKSEFQPEDYDERLLEEIKRRTQGESESVGVYFATATSLFSRLTCKLSEGAKVKILSRNILPTYQQQLALQTVDTVDELRRLCRCLENRREAIKDFKPPSSRARCLEPDLAYVEPDPATVADPTLASSSCSEARSQAPPTAAVCFNCGQSGHRAIGCNAPHKLRCFRCGLEGVTVRTCTTCAPARAPSGSTLSGNGRRRR